MLASFSELLDEARSTRSAIGAFTAYNGATAIGVVRAAEERDVPAILLVSKASLRSPNGRLFLPLLLAVAARAEVPTCVQLDHVTDESLMMAALEGGVGAVMADGSKLDFAENVAFARRAVKAAYRHGAHIEAELGHIEGVRIWQLPPTPGLSPTRRRQPRSWKQPASRASRYPSETFTARMHQYPTSTSIAWIRFAGGSNAALPTRGIRASRRGHSPSGRARNLQDQRQYRNQDAALHRAGAPAR